MQILGPKQLIRDGPEQAVAVLLDFNQLKLRWLQELSKLSEVLLKCSDDRYHHFCCLLFFASRLSLAHLIQVM